MKKPIGFIFPIYRNPVLFMITGAIIGFLVALLIFFFENIPGLSGDALKANDIPAVTSIRYLLNAFPDFFTWIMLFTIHTGAAVALGMAAFQKLSVFKKYQIEKKEITLSLALVFIMMIISSTSYIVPFNSGNYYRWPVMPLNHQWLKIILLLAISISAAGISVLGLILSGCACIRLAKEELQGRADQIIFSAQRSDGALFNDFWLYFVLWYDHGLLFYDHPNRAPTASRFQHSSADALWPYVYNFHRHHFYSL